MVRKTQKQRKKTKPNKTRNQIKQRNNKKSYKAGDVKKDCYININTNFDNQLDLFITVELQGNSNSIINILKSVAYSEEEKKIQRLKKLQKEKEKKDKLIEQLKEIKKILVRPISSSYVITETFKRISRKLFTTSKVIKNYIIYKKDNNLKFSEDNKIDTFIKDFLKYFDDYTKKNEDCNSTLNTAGDWAGLDNRLENTINLKIENLTKPEVSLNNKFLS